jgi:hypothetical protein
MHYSTNTAAAGRELHHAINPGLAEFDRLARKATSPKPVFTPQQYDERDVFRARARAIILRSLKEGF